MLHFSFFHLSRFNNAAANWQVRGGGRGVVIKLIPARPGLKKWHSFSVGGQLFLCNTLLRLLEVTKKTCYLSPLSVCEFYSTCRVKKETRLFHLNDTVHRCTVFKSLFLILNVLHLMFIYFFTLNGQSARSIAVTLTWFLCIARS